MKEYFNNFKSEKEITAEYKKLSVKHHPDKPGGSTQIMQEINKQRSEALKQLAISEGRAENYYEEIMFNSKDQTPDEFGKSLWELADKLENDFKKNKIDTSKPQELWNAVAKGLFGKKPEIDKKEKPPEKIEPKSE